MDLEKVPEPADLAVVDVSFISLMAVLPRIAQLLRAPEGKPIIALVKPQFEASREPSAKARLGTVAKIRTRATDHGFLAGDFVESPITGPAGNVEYLLLLRTKYNAATLVQATEQSPVPRNASADWGSSVAKRTLPIRGHCRLKGSPATGQRAVTTIVSRGYGWRVLDLPRRRAGGVRFTDLRGLTASRRS
jgi:hypothetical protein